MRTILTAAIAACSVLLAAPLAAAGPAAVSSAVPAKDQYKASVDSGTGRMARDRGSFEMDLALGASAGPARKLTVDFRGRGCGTRKRCLSPSGKLHGTLTPVFNRVADAGTRYRIHAGGTLKGMGRVSATGTVSGPGNIATGYMIMSLTVKAKHGSVALSARAGPVRGFTTP